MTRPSQTLGASDVVGAGVLGLVTVGMYDNPLTIYREYIQNAADAIAGLPVPEEGQVKITVDPSERRIKIWDNGSGLSYDDALQQLVPIGRSNKVMGSDRGFRGIGRLAGLAFAESVTFTTRARQEEAVTRITWNSGRLPSSANCVGRIEDVVRGCVEAKTLPGPEFPDHFFEVEMSGVARHAARPLLNQEAVRSYVSEVCPVPMATAFPYAKRIQSLFKSPEPPISLHITLNDDPEPVRRPHGKTIQLSANKMDDFKEFEEIHIPCLDSTEDAAVGWIAHSSYMGAIMKGAHIRGVRARVGNIQIGDDAVFNELHAEERFNRWCVGELHILDHRIVPNSRRDYFEPGPHLRNLENHLGPTLRNIGVRCRAASTARNRAQKALSLLSQVEQTYELATSGYLAGREARSLISDALQHIPSIREAILLLNLGTQYIDRLDGVKRQLLEFNSRKNPRPLNSVGLTQRAAYRQMFHELAKVAPTPSAARDLMAAVVKQASGARDFHTGAAK